MSERLNVYKRRIKKAQQGIKFVSYNVVEDPVIDYTDITNPINPFSEYYIPTTYNTEPVSYTHLTLPTILLV